jgi:hypothetical protein
MRLSFIGRDPHAGLGCRSCSRYYIFGHWLAISQLSRGQVCRVGAPELFSAHHAGAHTASDPSLCVSQSLGVSQLGPALCAARRLSGRRDESDAFQYDELPVKIGDRLTQTAQAAGPAVHQTGSIPRTLLHRCPERAIGISATLAPCRR